MKLPLKIKENMFMTMPLLSEILCISELMGYEHTSTLVQWLSSVYNTIVDT